MALPLALKSIKMKKIDFLENVSFKLLVRCEKNIIVEFVAFPAFLTVGQNGPVDRYRPQIRFFIYFPTFHEDPNRGHIGCFVLRHIRFMTIIYLHMAISLQHQGGSNADFEVGG